MSNFNPVDDRLVVKIRKLDNKTASGLIVVDPDAPKPELGDVVAVGPGRKSKKGNLVPVTIKIGETVMFTKGTGIPIKVNGEEYVILKEDEALGLVDQ
jgi:chaperonin GroES